MSLSLRVRHYASRLRVGRPEIFNDNGAEPESEKPVAKSRWFTSDQFDGVDLSGDYSNFEYTEACKAGNFATMPDCGHPNCGLLCDVFIRAVRRRRLQGAGR